MTHIIKVMDTCIQSRIQLLFVCIQHTATHTHSSFSFTSKAKYKKHRLQHQQLLAFVGLICIYILCIYLYTYYIPCTSFVVMLFAVQSKLKRFLHQSTHQTPVEFYSLISIDVISKVNDSTILIRIQLNIFLKTKNCPSAL